MDAQSLTTFQNLTYDAFRRRASDPSLSPHERIGFPDAYRAGKEEVIFADLIRKVPALSQPSATVVDIGPGCGPLAYKLIENASRNQQKLVLIDSPEMLANLPDAEFIQKIPGRFPSEVDLSVWEGKIDALISYSVLQYIVAEGNIIAFFDACLSMLAEQGACLLGDIPNSSQRKRFFHSPNGRRHHAAFTGLDEAPIIEHLTLERHAIDDGLLLGLLQRGRGFGFHTWIVPQASNLPMANRREDLLIVRP